MDVALAVGDRLRMDFKLEIGSRHESNHRRGNPHRRAVGFG